MRFLNSNMPFFPKIRAQIGPRSIIASLFRTVEQNHFGENADLSGSLPEKDKYV
jgi:hypothetical protein